MRADFALADHRLLARVHVFDRVFDGENVLRTARVDEVHDRRKRARFAVTGRAGDEHEPLMVIGSFGDVLRETERRERRHLARNHAHARFVSCALA